MFTIIQAKTLLVFCHLTVNLIILKLCGYLVLFVSNSIDIWSYLSYLL